MRAIYPLLFALLFALLVCSCSMSNEPEIQQEPEQILFEQLMAVEGHLWEHSEDLPFLDRFFYGGITFNGGPILQENVKFFVIGSERESRVREALIAIFGETMGNEFEIEDWEPQETVADESKKSLCYVEGWVSADYNEVIDRIVCGVEKLSAVNLLEARFEEMGIERDVLVVKPELRSQPL